jgi:hypothetical protein
VLKLNGEVTNDTIGLLGQCGAYTSRYLYFLRTSKNLKYTGTGNNCWLYQNAMLCQVTIQKEFRKTNIEINYQYRYGRYRYPYVPVPVCILCKGYQ